MRFTSLAIIAALSLVTPALGQDAAVSIAAPTMTFYTPPAPVPTPDLVAGITRLCESALPLSDQVRTACTRSTFPRLVADGTRFASAGIGAEFNTLIALVIASAV